MEGLAQLIRTINMVRERLNPRLAVEGILFTMFGGSTSLAVPGEHADTTLLQRRPPATAFRSFSTTSGPPDPLPTSSSPRRCSSMANRHGLGRGLGALLPPSLGESNPSGVAGVQEFPTAAIIPPPQQPRKDFDINALNDLAGSLQKSGVIQPIVVRKAGPGYQLIVGERRWRAAKIAGLSHIPAVVREV